jgi:hypothetical protein
MIGFPSVPEVTVYCIIARTNPFQIEATALDSRYHAA